MIRRLAHAPLGWRPTVLLLTVRRYRCSAWSAPWSAARRGRAPSSITAVVTLCARSLDGGAPACVVSYVGGPAVLIRLFDTTRSRWGLFLITSPHAAETCRDVHATANPTPS